MNADRNRASTRSHPVPAFCAAAVLLVLAVAFSVDGVLGERAWGVFLFIPLAAVLGKGMENLYRLGRVPGSFYGSLIGAGIAALFGLSVLLNFTLDHIFLPLLFVALAAGQLLRRR